MFKVGDKVVWQNPANEDDIAVGRIERVQSEKKSGAYHFREAITEFPILVYGEELVKLA